jgi:hypothetical protein
VRADRGGEVNRDLTVKELCESLRTNCFDALEDIVTAARSPTISKFYLEAAVAKLTVALDCAKALDE